MMFGEEEKRGGWDLNPRDQFGHRLSVLKKVVETPEESGAFGSRRTHILF